MFGVSTWRPFRRSLHVLLLRFIWIEVLDGVDVEILVEVALLLEDGEQKVVPRRSVEVDGERLVPRAFRFLF